MRLLAMPPSVGDEMEQEFSEYNESVLFERLKLISYMLILTYPYFFLVDFILFDSLSNPVYKLNLSIIHMISPVSSLLFLFIFHRFHNKLKGRIINTYIFLYLILGVAASINSQLFSGNIYAYIIIVLAVSVIFPIQPKHLAILIGGNHFLFIIGLYLLEHNHLSLLLKVINSTAAAVISFTMGLAFYSFRQNDFSNKKKLKKNEESFRRLFHLNPNPLILASLKNGRIMLMNQQAIDYYDLKVQDIGKLDGWFMLRESEKQDILEELRKKQSIKNYIQHNQNKWSMLNFEPVEYMDEHCVLIDSTDITELKKNEEELQRHASIDPLTGVTNRRKGMEILSSLIAEDSTDFIVCYIDINNLKKVNDVFGHALGDDLIITCCNTIKRYIGDDGILFRLGGDEFIILFVEKQMTDVQEIWKSIQAEFRDIHNTNQKPYPLSVSLGFYHFTPGTSITIEEILQQADSEMYKDKFQYKSQNEGAVQY